MKDVKVTRLLSYQDFFPSTQQKIAAFDLYRKWSDGFAEDTKENLVCFLSNCPIRKSFLEFCAKEEGASSLAEYLLDYTGCGIPKKTLIEAGLIESNAKVVRIVSINERENFGMLQSPRTHDAAVGIRIADNRSRDFGIFSDRITVIGEEKLAMRLRMWLLRDRTLKLIKKNVPFVFDGNGEEWSYDTSLGKDVDVKLNVICRGEYCYVAAYADLVKKDNRKDGKGR